MPNSRHNWLKFRCCSLARITNRTRCSRSSTMFHAILPAPGGPRSLLPPWLRSGQSVKDVVITTCKACHESEHLQARVKIAVQFLAEAILLLFLDAGLKARTNRARVTRYVMLSRRWAVRQEDLHDTAVRIRAIGKLDGTSVGLGDLLRQDQPNTRTARLGGVERNKSVAGIKQANAVVFNDQRYLAIVLFPSDGDLRSCGFRTRLSGLCLLKCGIDGIAHQVDQHLFDEVGIDYQDTIRARHDLDVEPSFQNGNAFQQLPQLNRLQGGRRHLRQPAIRLKKSMQRCSAGFDDVEAALKVRVLLFRQLRQRQTRGQAARDRNYRRQ